MLGFIFLLAHGAAAQSKDWRPISAEERSFTVGKVDKDADAEAIFWETRIDDSSSEKLTQRHYVRIKILNERGREKYSKVDIPFIKGVTSIKELSARVTKPDGTSVEIGKSDIFEREIVKASGIKVRAKSFAVPNIEAGVIVEYRYKQTTDDGSAKGMRLDFQKDIPVQTLSYYYKPYNKNEPKTQGYNFTDSTKFVKDEDGYYLAQRTNVPAFKEESQMPPANNVRPWMLLTGAQFAITELNSFNISFVVKDPSNPRAYWGGVAAEKGRIITILSDVAKEIKKTTEEVIAGATSDEDKIRRIYDYCQTKINNTTYDPTLTDEMRAKLPTQKTYKDIIKQASGSYSTINRLFAAMAIGAGFDVRYVISGDRSEMFFDPKMTNEDLVSFAGIGIKMGDDYRIFNPGIKFAPYGVLPWFRSDVWAMYIGEKMELEKDARTNAGGWQRNAQSHRQAQ